MGDVLLDDERHGALISSAVGEPPALVFAMGSDFVPRILTQGTVKAVAYEGDVLSFKLNEFTGRAISLTHANADEWAARLKELEA